jgi:spermidine synthase
MASAKVIMHKKSILKTSTALADIHIEQTDQELHLKFDDDNEAIQSAILLAHPHQLVMQNLQYLMGVLLFIPEPAKILMLGVGGGSLIHYIQHYLPRSEITAVENNAELLDICFAHFQLPRGGDQLTYVIDDARGFMQRDSQHYDLIVVDIFEGDVTPAWVLQEPFIQQLKNRLTVQGAVSCNLLTRNENTFRNFYRILRGVFKQQCLCLEGEDYENLLVYALNFRSASKSMSQLLELGWQYSERYELPFNEILSVIYNINPTDSGII